jgi:hypothetical protein
MIYIATHKHCVRPMHDMFQRVWLGRKDPPEGYISDENGNRFFKNQRNFAEVSALFYMSNVQEDLQGLFHYRRYFAFENRIINKVVTESEFDEVAAGYKIPDAILKKLGRNYIVRPRRVSYYHSIHNTLCKILSVDDMHIMYKVMYQLYPEVKSIVEDYMFRNNKMSCCNMFIANGEFCKSYVEWVTPIFDNLLKQVHISSYQVPSRIFGFLSEALMDIYISHKGYKVSYVPLLIGRDDLSSDSLLKYCVRYSRNEISHQINMPRKINYENYS